MRKVLRVKQVEKVICSGGLTKIEKIPSPDVMRRMNNLVTLFTAMTAFFFGSFITTMLTSIDQCPTQKSGIAKLEPHPDIFLMVLVLSAPNNIDQRQAMRDTWLMLLRQPLKQPYYPEEFVYLPAYDERGHLQMETVAEQANRLRTYLDWLDSLQQRGDSNIASRHIKVKHFFAIGTAEMNAAKRSELQKEHKQHKDILLLPRLVDNYANLTEKLLHSIDALTHHYEFSYLLKVDDDTYVKVELLLNELVSYDRKLLRMATDYHSGAPTPQLYWGYFNGRANIKTRGQWREHNYFLAQRYVTYAVGGGYILARQLCDHIAGNAAHLSAYVSEDISLGTWLAPLRHVYRRHDSRFDTGYMPRKCRRQHLVLHKRTAALMQDLYQGKLCSFELPHEQQFKRPAEYFYDWQKTADKCCDSLVL